MNQCESIVWYFKFHSSLTSKEAYEELGITQLGARLDDLEKQGYVVDRDEWIEVPDRQGHIKKVKNYKISKPGQQTLLMFQNK